MRPKPPDESSTQPRDAASVVLIRDGAAEIEAFTLTRPPTMAAFPNATVFPGGAAEHADELPEDTWRGIDLGPWTAAFGDDEATVRRLLVAAVRETFEECGVLLAGGIDTSTLRSIDAVAARASLENQKLSMEDFLSAYGVSLDVSLLRPLARWVTPEGNPRRYDTRFFLAKLPEGQAPVPATHEATTTQWLSPGTAFDLFRQGRTQLMPPTWSQFRTLSRFSSVNDALSAVLKPQQVRPHLVAGGSSPRVSFPHAHEFYAQRPQADRAR